MTHDDVEEYCAILWERFEMGYIDEEAYARLITKLDEWTIQQEQLNHRKRKRG